MTYPLKPACSAELELLVVSNEIMVVCSAGGHNWSRWLSYPVKSAQVAQAQEDHDQRRPC